jgi:tetraacyldisaccharide 4'-kinase
MKLFDLWSSDKSAPLSLRLIGSSWGHIMEKRRKAYHNGTFKPVTIKVPVISVGNLTLGGNAKTPLSIFLANALTDKGYSPAILSRGYKRHKTLEKPDPVLVSAGNGPLVPWEISGDEPYLMAKLTKAIILVASKRALAANEAVRLGADVIILDDGFQHLSLTRDINILSLQAENFLGNGYVFPAGPLREPPSAHKDADIFVAIGKKIHPYLERIVGDRPIFMAEQKPTQIVDFKTGNEINIDTLKEKRFCSFCGLARPKNLNLSLKSLNLTPIAFKAFPDHTVYESKKISFLENLLNFTHSSFLITTSKDAVKLQNTSLPIFVLKTALFLKDEEGFLKEIQSRIIKIQEIKEALKIKEAICDKKKSL